MFSDYNEESIKKASLMIGSFLQPSTAAPQILQFIVESILQVAGAAPGNWGLTLRRHFLRLNVGALETIALFPGTVHVVGINDALPISLRNDSSLEFCWGEGGEGHSLYKSVIGSFACNIDAAIAPKYLLLLKAAHRKLLERAIVTRRGSFITRAHTPEAVVALSRLTATVLVQPTHVTNLSAG